MWLCKINNHEVTTKTVHLMKGESRTPEFKSTVNPMGKIPVLKDGDWTLTESHAIMIYLAEKHGWDQWYPKDLKTRTRIHEYMNWHHLNARLSSQIFVQQIQVNMGRATPAVEASLKRKHKVIDGIFAMLEFWLRHGNEYLMTQSHASLADISCYNEVVQLEVMGLLTDVDAKFPKAAAWLKRMKKLPHHDEQLAPMMKFFQKFKLIPSKM